ncbi:MAG TPA: ThiF family adenylyltransferase [bacterium]|jgi:adenylyltransferase/sulfurtransferase
MNDRHVSSDDVFSRHYLLDQIGREGQAALLKSHATIVGMGATGSRIAELLVRAGVGRLTIIDRDYVDFSNLTRQTLYTWSDAERCLPKAEAARRHLNEIMPTCQVYPKILDLTADNIHFILKGAHVVCDGTDNFDTRYLINDWCITEGVQWVYAGAVGVEASVFPIIGRHACLRCIFPDPVPPGSLPTCDTSGVIGTATSLAASHAATLAIRMLVNDIPDPILRTWNVWDGTDSSLMLDQLKKSNEDEPCPLCTDYVTEFLDSEVTDESRALCGRDTVQINTGRKIDLNSFGNSIDGEVENNGFLLKFKVNEHTIHLFEDGRAMVSGTRNVSEARSILGKWVGT